MPKPVKPETPPTDKPEIRYVDLYAANPKVYTRRITGFYQRLRRYTGIPLMLGFLLLPWLQVDGRPAAVAELDELRRTRRWIEMNLVENDIG